MAENTVAPTSASQVGIQDFLRILVAQLSHQDPLKPMDNQEFVAQLAQFTTLQQTQELNDKLGSLLGAQAAMQSVGMLGRNVELAGDSGPVFGRVSAIRFVQGEPRLSVTLTTGSEMNDVTLSRVVTVR